MTTGPRKGIAGDRPAWIDGWISYNFAVLRVVPHVHAGVFVPVGVVVHARTTEFLEARVITNSRELARLVSVPDVELLSRYLESCAAICAGEAAAGPIALAPPSERFHWITAPRSDVIQSGPVHEGLCEDPRVEIDKLFTELIGKGVRISD
jgi:hypothetical protein